MISSARKCALVASFAASFAAASRVASAALEPDATQLEAARRLYEEAIEAEQRGDFAEAQAKLERAAAVKLTASVRFHLAFCDEKQGRLVSALTRYEGALDQALADKKPEVAKVAEAATTRLKKIVPSVTLHVAGDAARAPESVMLDGRVVVPTLYETPMRVEPGTHRVEARRKGYRAFFETWDARTGEERTVEIALAPEAPGAKRLASTPAEAPSNTRAMIALGIGISAATLGTVAYFASGALETSGSDLCAPSNRPTCSDHQGAIRALDVTAVAFWGIGAAALGTSAYFFVRGPQRESSPNRVSSELRWSPGGVVYERIF